MLIYFYDLKTRLKDYNKIKRRFYYDLKKTRLSLCQYKTKSVIIVDDSLEPVADRFFFNYRRYLEVYKARASSIEDVF